MPNRKFVPISFLIFISFCAVALCGRVLALDDDRLWLPRSYQTLYLNLKDAALAAEALNRCVSVLDGTIDLAQSTNDKPVFRIRCRQENGRTYSEMVDGLSFETLTTQEVEELTAEQVEVKELTAEELELLKIEEERLKEEEKVIRLRRLWQLCDQSLAGKTRLMNNFKRVTEEMPQPDVSEDNQVIFTLDFDAEDLSGTKLEYQARCIVHDEQLVDVSIGKRP